MPVNAKVSQDPVLALVAFHRPGRRRAPGPEPIRGRVRGGDGEAGRRQHPPARRQGVCPECGSAQRRQVDGDGEEAPRLEGERGPDVYLYGEDIYGIHSIEYKPVPEHETFRGICAPGWERRVCVLCGSRSVREATGDPGRGRFCSRGVSGRLPRYGHSSSTPTVSPRWLGGEREGVVLRLARGFPVAEFSNNVCKSVRPGHVQTEEHWTRNWRPCRIARTSG